MRYFYYGCSLSIDIVLRAKQIQVSFRSQLKSESASIPYSSDSISKLPTVVPQDFEGKCVTGRNLASSRKLTEGCARIQHMFTSVSICVVCLCTFRA